MAAVVTKYGYSAAAARLIGTSVAAFAYMAIGSGSQAENTDAQTLQSEATDTGLVRAAVADGTATTEDGKTVVSSAATGDTAWFRNTWTCGVASIESGVQECGVFNSDTKDAGDMLCYGVFPTAIPMSTEDTLQVTWSVQATAGA